VEDALQEQEILETQTSIGSHVSKPTAVSLSNDRIFGVEADFGQSLYNQDSFRGSLAPHSNSRLGMSGMRSPATSGSNLLRFDTGSSIASDSDDGVWTGQAENRPGRDGSDSDSVSHSSAVTVGTTQTGLDDTPRQRRESSQTSVAPEDLRRLDKWAKQGAPKPDRGALLNAEKQREAQRKVQEQERARFQEEESSGSDWEL
jgi:hypothetical protein